MHYTEPKAHQARTQSLLEAIYQASEEAINDRTFLYENTQVVAVAIRQRPKTIPKFQNVCLLEPHDLLEFLKSGGTSALWAIPSGGNRDPSVRFSIKNRDGTVGQVQVSRWLTGAGAYEKVTFRNGQWLDLRRSNLKVQPTQARHRPYSDARAQLEAHLPHRMFPSWDLYADLVDCRRLDLTNPFRLEL